MALDDLRRSPMMTHLLDSLEKGKDIGHYGRLTFAMIAHRFLDRDELVTWLCKDKDCDETKAKALVQQVESRDYNPPSREPHPGVAGRAGLPDLPDSGRPERLQSLPRAADAGGSAGGHRGVSRAAVRGRGGTGPVASAASVATRSGAAPP